MAKLRHSEGPPRRFAPNDAFTRPLRSAVVYTTDMTFVTDFRLL